MSQRRYYLALIGMLVIMISGVTLLVSRNSTQSIRNPEDVLWMEKIRRSALATLVPVINRIDIDDSKSTAIRVEGMGNYFDDPVATINMDFTNRSLALEVLAAAKNNILQTSGWNDGQQNSNLRPPRHAKHLFELKDHLWSVTIEYIDTLELIYGREVEVPSSQINFIREQMETHTILLEEEMNRLGLGTLD